MAGSVYILGSMATRGLLTEAAQAWECEAAVRSMGGLAAAQLLRNGEEADVVVLAGAAMDQLQADGLIVPGTQARVAISSMVAAVRTGEPAPALSDADGVRRAVLAARRIGYSTGPSGDHLLSLLDAWGVREALAERLVQAPPGVPVGRLLAEGAVDLGFQQRSELMNLEGVTIAGVLPPAIAADTVFTAGMGCSAKNAGAARRLIAFLASAETAPMKLRHGLQPA